MEFKNIQQVEKYTLRILKKYCKHSWSIDWMKRKRVAGMCSPAFYTVHFSKILFELNIKNTDFITNTVLHEIAHAIDYERNKKSGHDPTWKAICQELGIEPERCIFESDIIMPGKYLYQCPVCSFKLTRSRRYIDRAACPFCCKKYNHGRFSDKYLLQLVGS